MWRKTKHQIPNFQLKNCSGLSFELFLSIRGESVEHLHPPFDAIIASGFNFVHGYNYIECIYYEELVEPLCETISKLSGDKTTTFVSFEEHRPESVESFFKTMQRRGFKGVEVLLRYLSTSTGFSRGSSFSVQVETDQDISVSQLSGISQSSLNIPFMCL